MFDPITEELIAGAPDLSSLKSSDMVELLTAAHVEVAAARLRMEGSDSVPDSLPQIRERMSRLADVFEAQVALEVNADRLRPMVFVSGSARQIVGRVEELISSESRTSQLDEDCIGADISSALLFLVSERFSDAAEAGRSIRASGELNRIRRLLILTIGRLARGQFDEIAKTSIEDTDGDADDVTALATDLLYQELLVSIVILAQVSIGDREFGGLEDAYSRIDRVISMAGGSILSVTEVEKTTLVARTTFSGPHHLASLLRVAARSIAYNLLVNTPTPKGGTQEAWSNWIVKEAKRRPLTWENHRAAIATGFLDVGSSMIMTTPTGTGKSTLSALKIASTLSSGKTVLYLAPTHALVSQVEYDLNERLSDLARAESIDEQTLDETVDRLPDIAVMTPEKCFALLTFAPTLFSNVGLFVFDEFHLMSAAIDPNHPSGVKADRRSIDAMLCFLSFLAVNDHSDFLLLSAMVANGEKLKDWLNGFTDTKVVAFDSDWKPTRQLRGCIVYSDQDLKNLTRSLNFGIDPSVPKAIPYGLFSLSSNWLPKSPDKSALKPLSDQPIPLAIGGQKSTSRRWLTSNRNVVAADIATKLALHGLKVLVFCETITMVGSTAEKINHNLEKNTKPLTADQAVWRETAIEEVGSESAIYDAGKKVAAVHHGELLSYERRLVESLFRTPDTGVNVLVATSTLAQGLNLPCDVVVLAGTDRLDPNTEKRKIMQEHEILNALGRAGRAGYSSTGLSLVVPGDPIPCNIGSLLPQDLTVPNIVFTSKDRCVPLIDPLCTLLDEIEVDGDAGTEAEYLARRFSIALKTNEDGNTPFETLVRSSLGYFELRTQSQEVAEAWLNGRRSILRAVLSDKDPETPASWQQTLAAKTGSSVEFILKLENALPSAPWMSINTMDWASWVLDQFDPESRDFDTFFRPEALEKVFGRSYKNQKKIAAKREVALAGIKTVLSDWFGAIPLVEIDKTITDFIAANEGQVQRPTSSDKNAKYARRFSIRFASEIGFLMSTFSQLVIEVERVTGKAMPPMPGFLPQLARFGFPTPYHFALSRELEVVSRVELSRSYEKISKNIVCSPEDDWDIVRSKVSNAYSISLFPVLSDEEIEKLSQLISNEPS